MEVLKRNPDTAASGRPRQGSCCPSRLTKVLPWWFQVPLGGFPPHSTEVKDLSLGLVLDFHTRVE